MRYRIRFFSPNGLETVLYAQDSIAAHWILRQLKGKDYRGIQIMNLSTGNAIPAEAAMLLV